MKKMVGEIGSILLGDEQVGGFKHWTVNIDKSIPHSSVTASKFWMFNKPDTNKFDAKFYAETDNGLKMVREEQVIIEFPQHELDTMTTQPLKMDMAKDFDWRK